MAVSSFVLGILSVILGWVPFLGQIMILLSIIFGFSSLSKIRKDDSLKGKKLAIAGLIMGFFWIIIIIIGVLAYFAFQDEKSGEKLECAEWEMKLGGACCGNQDANQICDEDEVVSQEMREKYEQMLYDKGDFKVVWASIVDDRYYQYQRIFKDQRIFENVADSLNEMLLLPNDLSIYIRDCSGVINAFYDPENKNINICYELMDYIYQSFSEVYADQESISDATMQTTFFIFYHEMGHALVDTLNLPVTGKEEDAVDQLATALSIQGGYESYALNSAVWFGLEGSKSDVYNLNFADEHSLNQQRFYNILCWIYGSDPLGYWNIVANGALPVNRALRCAAEYEQMSNSWNTLLSPYIKERPQGEEEEPYEGD